MTSPITTHVLDTSRGRPAVGIAVGLEQLDDAGTWQQVGQGATNDDGRVTDLMPHGGLAPGRYRIHFATGEYFAAQGKATFYPHVIVEFEIAAADQHYHVPLLVSPFGYSTYRGS